MPLPRSQPEPATESRPLPLPSRPLPLPRAVGLSRRLASALPAAAIPLRSLNPAVAWPARDPRRSLSQTMPYNSAMTAVLKCNNCAKSGRDASAIMMYLTRYAAKRGLEARSAEVIFEFQSRGGLTPIA